MRNNFINALKQRLQYNKIWLNQFNQVILVMVGMADEIPKKHIDHMPPQKTATIKHHTLSLPGNLECPIYRTLATIKNRPRLRSGKNSPHCGQVTNEESRTEAPQSR